MARYKVLKGVAQSLGHSFSSDMTYAHGDYALGHLLRRAREVGKSSVEIDLLTDSIVPAAFEGSPGALALHRYSAWFPSLVESNGSDMSLVRGASLRVEFDHSQVVPLGTRFERVRYAPHDPGSPVDVLVTIIDDRGKAWASRAHSWEYPLISNPPVTAACEPAPSGLRGLVARLLQRRA